MAVNPDCRRLLVGIRRRGDLTPLHLVHSLAGELTWLPLLARRIDDRRPLYGFAAPGLNADVPAPASLNDLAASYLAAVRSAQPRGPYLFGGYSFGGMVAYEMARQAFEAGDQVEGLLLVDAYTPDSSSMQALMRWARAGILIQAIGNLLALDWRAPVLLGPDSLRPADPEQQIDLTTRHLLEQCRIPHTYEALRTILKKCHRVTQRHIEMLAGYRPGPAPAPFDAILIHNTEGLVGATNTLRLPDLGEAAAGRDHGWGGYLSRAPKRFGISTEHFLMMRPPALDEVARLIEVHCPLRTFAPSPHPPSRTLT